MGNKKIITLALESTRRSAVHITAVQNKITTTIDSKFGGAFYLPKGKQVPTYRECDEMEFLAQLNFSQLPHIEGFPKKGLLQFFLCTDDEQMEDMEDIVFSSSGYFQIIYYPEVDDKMSFHKEQQIKNRWPMEKIVGGMDFKIEDEIATLSIGQDGFETVLGCEDVLDALKDLSFKQLKQAGYDLSDCPDTNKFCLDFGNWGYKIGGYPSIRQGDVRLEKEQYRDYSTLLFQFDLTKLGQQNDLEAETFCFFMKPNDLKACYFEDVLLMWHNCF